MRPLFLLLDENQELVCSDDSSVSPCKNPARHIVRSRMAVRKFDGNEDFFGKIGRGVSNIREVIIFVPGKLPEWSNGTDSKSVELRMWFLGFESLTFRHDDAGSQFCGPVFFVCGCRIDCPTAESRSRFGHRSVFVSRFDGPTMPYPPGFSGCALTGQVSGEKGDWKCGLWARPPCGRN